MITEPENYNLIFKILTCNEGTDTQADIKRGGICSTCVNAKLHKSYPKHCQAHQSTMDCQKISIFSFISENLMGRAAKMYAGSAKTRECNFSVEIM